MALDVSTLKTVSKKKKKEDDKSIFDFLNKDISLFGKSLSDKKKEAFYHEMAILLIAGVDIKTTLELIAEEQTNKKDKILYLQLKDKIIAGSTLSDAIKGSEYFSPYEFHSLQIGEESGKLTIVLEELASYYKNKVKQKRQIISALTYPIIVLCTAVGAIFFMMNFIVPMFAEVFKRFGGELPFITSLILSISDSIAEYFYIFFLAIIAIVSFVALNKKKVWFRNATSSIVLKIPFLGEMVRKIYLARFSQSMTLLIGSRIPLLRSIQLVKQMIGYYPIEVSLTEIEKDILQGNSLNNSMSKHAIYSKRMVSLVKVGEEVNQLDIFFDKVRKQLDDDIEYQTGMIASTVEPLMIIFLGLIVGIVLVAMYLPLFQLSTTF
jgi:type IV pilus assembly protein PilC